MAKVLLIKQPGGLLKPANQASADALQKVKNGATVSADIVQPRNYKFHQKFFELINVAFDLWCETRTEIRYKGEIVEPNKDRFRKDIIILSGYYTAVENYKGELRLEAKSISFARMGEEEFEQLYQAAISTILSKIIPHRTDIDESVLRQWVDDVLQFA